ncbi:MAG: MCP four helix bundle domain-containing protein [candidate division Zixibacteria bacterium]
MKIGPKLIGSFSIVAIICGIVGFVGWYGIGQVDEHMDEIGAVRLPAIQAAMTMDAIMGDVATAQMELLNVNGSIEEALGQYEAINEAFVEIESAAEDFQKLIADAEEERIFNEVMTNFNEFKAAANEFVNRSKQLDELGIRNPMKLIAEISEIENAHREWLFQLNETVVEKVDFEGEIDPDKCPLGIWMKEFNLNNKTILSSMETLKTYHNSLHATVPEINDIYNRSKNDMAAAAVMDVFDEKSMPAMDQVVAQIDGVINAEGQKAYAIYQDMDRLDMEVLEPKFDQVMALLEELNSDVDTGANEAREEGDAAAVEFTYGF